jgi:hypothetical protein
MTRFSYATVVGVIGSAVGIWIWRRNLSRIWRKDLSTMLDSSDGVVIYHNTPTVSEGA